MISYIKNIIFDLAITRQSKIVDRLKIRNLSFEYRVENRKLEDMLSSRYGQKTYLTDKEING